MGAEVNNIHHLGLSTQSDSSILLLETYSSNPSALSQITVLCISTVFRSVLCSVLYNHVLVKTVWLLHNCIPVICWFLMRYSTCFYSFPRRNLPTRAVPSQMPTKSGYYYWTRPLRTYASGSLRQGWLRLPQLFSWRHAEVGRHVLRTTELRAVCYGAQLCRQWNAMQWRINKLSGSYLEVRSW